MHNDPQDDLLRQQAQIFATKLVRSPALAVGYRDALSEAVEDSDLDGKLRDWIISAGFTTDRARLAAAFEAAPRELLALWDGFYLVQVDNTIAALQLDALGVQLDGLKVADATFADGVLRFSPTKLSPWSGELTFSHAGWNGETPFPSAAMFEKSCKGRLWAASAKRPETVNAAGATRRVLLGSSRHVTGGRAALASLGDPPVDWTFFTQFFGSYIVHWNQKPDANPTIRQFTVGGAKNGVAVQFSNEGSNPVTLTTAAQHPSEQRLKFDDEHLAYDLEFARYGDNVRTFFGKIYPKGGAAPNTNNAVGALEIPPSTWNVPAIVGTALGAGGLLLTIFSVLYGIIPILASKRDAEDIKKTLKSIEDSSWPQMDILKREADEKRRAFDELDEELKETEQAHADLVDRYKTQAGELNRDLETQQREIAQLKIERAAAIKDGDALKAERLRGEEEAKSSAERTMAREVETTEEKKENVDAKRKETQREQKEMSEMKK